MSIYLPSRTEFDQAISTRSKGVTFRLKMAEPELREGAVETFQQQNNLGQPLIDPFGMEGGFAIVYKYHTKSGKLVALRCFKKRMSPETKTRYEKIGPYFEAEAKDITVRFKYYDEGILVKSSTNLSDIFPIIEMDWVEGTTLLTKIEATCRNAKSNLAQAKAVMEALFNEWSRVLGTMRLAKIAHTDLQGFNIMVKPDNSMVLIDYDGVYIPDFKSKTWVTLGHADYQHPGFLKQDERTFDQSADNFSALVIYSALLALKIDPTLWNSYAIRALDGKLLSEGMLFAQKDFANPTQSALFSRLLALGHPDLTAAVSELKKDCALPVGAIPFAANIIDARKQALDALEKAIKSDDDEKIEQAWVSSLHNYDPAKPHLPRVEVAKDRNQAYPVFAAAISADDDNAIISRFHPSLKDSNRVTPQQRARHDLAVKRVQALNKLRLSLFTKDERKISETYDTILDGYPGLLPIERQQVDAALRCVGMPADVRAAIAKDDDDLINSVYDPKLVRPFTDFTAVEQARINLAATRAPKFAAFQQAVSSDQDDLISQSYHLILDNHPRITDAQHQRLALARTRLAALTKLRVALMAVPYDERGVSAAYDPLLDNYPQISPYERQQVELAIRCVEMPDKVRAGIAGNDDEVIEKAYVPSLLRPFTAFTANEQQRIELAIRRTKALNAFRMALVTKDDDLIISAYDPVLNEHPSVLPYERQLLANFFKRRNALNRFRAALKTNNDQQIYQSYDPILDNHPKIQPRERDRLQTAISNVSIRLSFDEAVAQGDILAALAIEQTMLQPVSDASWNVAKLKYISDQKISDLRTTIQGDHMRVEWTWPLEPQVRHAALAWRSDRMPSRPDEPGTNTDHVSRLPNAGSASTTLQVGSADPIMIRIFLAIEERKPFKDEPSWLYSNSRNPVFTRVAHRPRTVLWGLDRQPGSPSNSLELRTVDGRTLPEMVIVRKAGGMPLSASDGDKVAVIDYASHGGNGYIKVPLDVANWPPKTILRVFPANDADSDWLVINGPSGVRIQV